MWSIKSELTSIDCNSPIINLLWGFDILLNIIWPNGYEFLCDHFDCKFLLGDEIYDLADKGLFKFILEKCDDNIPYHQFRLANMNILLLTDIVKVKKLLVNPNVKRGKSYDRLIDFFGYGIFTSKNTKRWYNQRKSVHELFKFRNLTPYAKEMYDITKHEMSKYSNTDLVSTLSQVGLLIFCDTILQIDVRDNSNIIIEPLNKLLKYINSSLDPISLSFGHKYNEFMFNRNIVHNWLNNILDRLTTENALANYINKCETREEKIELLLSVILGGHETTSRLMLGILYSLYTNKECLDKLRNELNCNSQDYITYNDKLSYLDAVVNEGLRLFPPVWILSREPQVDIVIDELLIKKDTQVLISPLVMQRNESIWKNAESFIPERFIDFTDSCNFIPYLIGNENCAGKNFANFETKIVIGCIVRNFNIEIVDTTLHPMSSGTFRLTDILNVNISCI